MVRWFWRQRETHRLVPRLHSVGPERDGAMNGLPSVQRALGSRERERESYADEEHTGHHRPMSGVLLPDLPQGERFQFRSL